MEMKPQALKDNRKRTHIPERKRALPGSNTCKFIMVKNFNAPEFVDALNYIHRFS